MRASTVNSLAALDPSTLIYIAHSVYRRVVKGIPAPTHLQGALNLGSLLSKEQWPVPAALQLFQQHARLHSSSSASKHSQNTANQHLRQRTKSGRQQQLQQQQQQQQQQQRQQQRVLAADAAAPFRTAVVGTWQDRFVQHPSSIAGCRQQQQQQQQQREVFMEPEQQQQRRHRQQQQLLQQWQQQPRLQAGPSDLPRLLREAAIARKDGDTTEEQRCLQQATEEVLAQLDAASVDTVQALLRAYAANRFALSEQQLQQLLQHLADNADVCAVRQAVAAVSAVLAAARAVAAAAAAGEDAVPAAARLNVQRAVIQQQQMLMQRYSSQLRPLVVRSLQSLMEQLQQAPAAKTQSSSTAAAAAAVTPAEVTWSLTLHERIKVLPMPQHEMQQLLQHASATAEQYSLPQVLRVLYHSRASELPLQSIQHEPLLDRALELLLQDLQQQQQQQMSADAASRAHSNTVKSGAAVLHAFENAGVIVPQAALQLLVTHMVADASRCQPSHAFRVIRSAAFAGLQLQPDELQPLVARAMLLKTADKNKLRATLVGLLRAVSHMGAQLPQQQLDALVLQLLGLVPQGGLPADEAAAVLKAVACMGMQLPRPLLKPLLRPLQRGVREGKQLHQLPQLLTAAARMGVDLPYATEMAHLLKAAKLALKAEAKAAARAADKANSGSSSSRGGRLAQQQQQERLPASLIADLVRALQHTREQLPTFYALPLTDAFLQQQPAMKDIASYLAGFGAMKLAVSLPHAAAVVQRLLQPDQFRDLTSSNVGSILWGFARMGYNLERGVLEVLVQQQLAQPRRSVAYSYTQTLWAIANMGPSTVSADGLHWQQQQQQQQQGDVVQPQLLQQLLQQIYDELAAKAAGEQQQQQQQQQQHVSSDDARTWVTAGPAAMYWQVSVAAWAAAVCDAAVCQPQILQMCHLLAAPNAWQMLRTNELVQLSWVHLWLCNYQWSDAGGLAACLTQQQLADIKSARQQQVQRVAAASCTRFSSSSSRGDDSRHAQQQQDDAAIDAVDGMQAWCLGSDNEATSSSSSRSCMQQEQMLPKRQQQQQQQTLPPSQGASVSQIELCNVLQGLPCIASTKLEAITDDGLFSVDVEAVTVDGHRLAVEFDGPYHYAQQVMVELPASGSETGATAVSAAVEEACEVGQHDRHLPSDSAAAATAAGVVQVAEGDVIAAAAAVRSARSTAAAAARASAVAEGLRLAPPSSIALPAAFKANNQDYSSLVLKRTALFRDKALRARGYTVVCVPFHQWASRQLEVQQWQVQRLIQAAIAAQK